MEYSPSAAFVDAATAVVEKRSWPAVSLEQSRSDGWLVVVTAAMRLRYREGSGPFAAANLEVSWQDRAGHTHVWHPGDVDRANLGGLTHSLDNVDATKLPAGEMDLGSPVDVDIPGIDVPLAKAKPGLLSRSGYAFLDDSGTPVVNAAGTWIEPRAVRNGQDWYLFTYDRDYGRVLKEYAELCGPIPMIPRYVLGAWITDLNFEYFPGTLESRQPEFERYDERHLMDEVSRLRRARIPLDALVLDFAWHNYGWQGGYDWSPLIPHPDALSRWLHARGVKLALNDHPGYANTEESILSFSDSHAPEVLEALGRAWPPKPSFETDISSAWSFATDPRDEGLAHHWYAAVPDAGRWQPVRIGPWESQGYRAYRGVGWYRATVDLPATLPRALYLYLGQVGQSYRIFVNGTEATHSQAHWPRRLTYTDITPYVRAGGPNEIVLRVEPAAKPDEEGSGIVRGPVAIRDVKPPERIYFDLSDEKQAGIFMRDLHGPLMRQGVDLWWVDGGSGAVDMPGLNKQLWTNKVFYDYSERESGKRAFILARYGDWGSERYPGFFTGDTYSQWPVLAYEVAFSARGGNVLVPYISHDIGGFHGAIIDFDLYARWIEFGAFSAILRMHSAHENPREGNVRMPWVYGERGVRLMRKYFTLRTQLIPYLYSYAWLAHTESLPLMRPLYLAYPELDEAYRHSHEYFLGEALLVAPVLDASGERTVWLPPGEWLEFFTGKRHQGGGSFTAHYAADETPLFVRQGAIIPEQAASEYSDARPLARVILNVYGSGNGRFDLYEDDGISLAYASGQRAHTLMTHSAGADGSDRLVIEPTEGSYTGQPPQRSYELRIRAARKPATITVDGEVAARWSWDAKQETAVVELPKRSIRERLRIEWRR
ncbi:MAG TPA: TIM-barrel domain-containing protein [Steroidobacteraceae bacterium]|nr:TIM-barrel domain-containing protein [Steroidobacteraceae bacterium]